MELTVDQAIQLLRFEEAKLKDVEARMNQSMALLNELQLAKATLQNLPGKKTEGLLPIGGGVMLPALTEKGNVLINVGAGVVVEKSLEDAVSFLDKRIKMIEENMNNLARLAQKTAKNISVLRAKIDEAIKARQGPAVVG